MDREAAARKTRAFEERMDSENHGLMFATNEACQTCMFARGSADWQPPGQEIRPDLCFCKIYEPDDGGLKPHDVAFEGAPCEYYEKRL